MNSSEYIISRLKQLACNIPNIQIRYEFRIITQTHIVEVLPLIFFKENEQYINEEVKLETDFEQLYPSENIVFISESSLTEIRNP